jgi:hypothetical protein
MDEQPAQTAAQQSKKLPRLDRPRRQIRRSDQANIADVTPACGNQVHQPARAAAKPEDPQQQEAQRLLFEFG